VLSVSRDVTDLRLAHAAERRAQAAQEIGTSQVPNAASAGAQG
jgi:hypothetical protein